MDMDIDVATDMKHLDMDIAIPGKLALCNYGLLASSMGYFGV